MKITVTNPENATAIALTMHALMHQMTDDVTVEFENGYTASLYMHADGQLYVALIRTKSHLVMAEDLNPFDAGKTKEFLELLSRATSDFDAGVVYARFAF